MVRPGEMDPERNGGYVLDPSRIFVPPGILETVANYLASIKRPCHVFCTQWSLLASMCMWHRLDFVLSLEALFFLNPLLIYSGLGKCITLISFSDNWWLICERIGKINTHWSAARKSLLPSNDEPAVWRRCSVSICILWKCLIEEFASLV